MTARQDTTTDDSMLSRLGDGLDSIMFGKHSTTYTWFVRGVVAAFAVLALLSLFTDTSPAIDALTGIVFALFVLTAVVQMVALARRLQRSQETIDKSADALDETADEVAEAADQVAALSDEVTKGTNSDPETVERTAGDVKKQAEHAKGTAGAVKEQMGGEKAKWTKRTGQDERDEREQ